MSNKKRNDTDKTLRICKECKEDKELNSVNFKLSIKKGRTYYRHDCVPCMNAKRNRTYKTKVKAVLDTGSEYYCDCSNSKGYMVRVEVCGKHCIHCGYRARFGTVESDYHIKDVQSDYYEEYKIGV